MKMIGKMDGLPVFEFERGKYVAVNLKDEKCFTMWSWFSNMGRWADTFEKCEDCPDELECLNLIEQDKEDIVKNFNKYEDDVNSEDGKEILEEQERFYDWLDDDRGMARRQLEAAKVSLGHTQNALRSAIWGMTEDDEGPKSFAELMRYAISRMPQWEGIVSFSAEGREEPWARRYASAMLLVLQEAVANAVTHGIAANVRVRLRFAPDALAVSIADDGCGFDTKTRFSSDHLGIASMKRRICEMGGRFSLKSVCGRGTRIMAGILKGKEDDKPSDR